MPRTKTEKAPPPLSTGLSSDLAATSLHNPKRRKPRPAKRPASWRYPVAHDAPVFDPADEAAWLAFLAEYGYVVVQALSAAEVQAAEDTFWDEAAAHLGWSRDDPRSWEANERIRTMSRRSDCGHFRGFDQSALVWQLRKAPSVRRVYNAISRRYCGAADGEPQLCAFNSINLFRPHGVNPAWKTTAEPWYHVDNPKPDASLRQEKVVFPGMINLMEVSADTGGFVCVPKSHLLLGKRPSADSVHEGEYLDLEPYDNFVDSEANARAGNTLHTQPILPTTGGRRGTLLVWDPRLVHCSTCSLTPPERNARAREARLLRLAAFVAACPARWASAEAIAQRRRMVSERMCANTHIPWMGDAATQRRFEAVAFYEGVWDDADAVRLIEGDEPPDAEAVPAEPEGRRGPPLTRRAAEVPPA